MGGGCLCLHTCVSLGRLVVNDDGGLCVCVGGGAGVASPASSTAWAAQVGIMLWVLGAAGGGGGANFQR